MKIVLEGELQTRTSFEMNSEGYLVLKVIPERVYNYINLKKLEIYFPGTLRILTQDYHIRIILGGREVFYNVLSAEEIRMLEVMEPIVT